MRKNKIEKNIYDCERRLHGCDGCYKSIPTELFVGYCGNLLWMCHKCYKRITKGIIKKHENNEVSCKIKVKKK